MIKTKHEKETLPEALGIEEQIVDAWVNPLAVMMGNYAKRLVCGGDKVKKSELVEKAIGELKPKGLKEYLFLGILLGGGFHKIQEVVNEKIFQSETLSNPNIARAKA